MSIIISCIIVGLFLVALLTTSSVVAGIGIMWSWYQFADPVAAGISAFVWAGIVIYFTVVIAINVLRNMQDIHN